MRCRMCGIWTRPQESPQTEMSLEQYRRILSDPLFSELEFVNLNGGEPNLRDDLVSLAALISEGLPRLKAVSINTNGLPPETTVRHVREMSRIFRERGIRFSVSVSLHGPDESHDRITGTPGAFARVKEGLDRLRDMRTADDFYLSVNCVITGLNVRALESMLDWSEREGIPVNFTLGEVRERFINLDMGRTVRVESQDQASLVRFLRGLGRNKARFRQHALRYAHLADMIEGRTKRKLACHYDLAGVILGSDGLLYYCKNSKAIGDAKETSPLKIYFDPQNLAYKRSALWAGACPSCPPNTYNIIEVEHDLFKLAKFWVFGKKPKR
jgi:MoaA/NifB/PqqE/SkfB family radical SAM enzyme